MKETFSSSELHDVQINNVLLRMARTRRVRDDDLETLILYIDHLRHRDKNITHYNVTEVLRWL